MIARFRNNSLSKVECFLSPTAGLILAKYNLGRQTTCSARTCSLAARTFTVELNSPRYNLTYIANYQRQFEAVKPARQSSSAARDTMKDFVLFDS
jgi:hypothetical protein